MSELSSDSFLPFAKFLLRTFVCRNARSQFHVKGFSDYHTFWIPVVPNQTADILLPVMPGVLNPEAVRSKCLPLEPAAVRQLSGNPDIYVLQFCWAMLFHTDHRNESDFCRRTGIPPDWGLLHQRGCLLISDKWNKLNSDIAQSDIPDIVPVKCYQPPSCPFSYYNAPEKKSTSAFQKKFIKISELRGMVK